MAILYSDDKASTTDYKIINCNICFYYAYKGYYIRYYICGS